MKYIKPEIDIIKLEENVITASGDYTEGETPLENDKVIQAPIF